MNKIWRLCFAVATVALLCLFGFQVDAEEYTQSFMGKWDKTTVYTDEDIEVLPTENELFGGKLHIINYNGEKDSCEIVLLAGSLPDAASSVTVTEADGTTKLATKNISDNVLNNPKYQYYMENLPENHFAIGFRSNPPRPGIVFCIFITDGNNHTEKYTFMVKGPGTVADSYSSQYPYRYAKNIDLVDAARDNEIIEPLVKTENWTAEDSPSVCRKITLPEGKKEVALRFSREEADEENDLKIPDTYDYNSNLEWMDCTRRLVRVNDSAWMYCTDATKERDRVSPNLELKKGWNVVQIGQTSGCKVSITDGQFHENITTQNQWPNNGLTRLTFLIYCEEDTLSEKNSNTAISSIMAYVGPKKKDDPLPACEVAMEETGEDAYRLVMPSGRICDQIMVRVDLEDPGASWNFVDEAGTDIGVGADWPVDEGYIGIYGYIGDWGAFNASGRDKVYIKVTASDGTTQTTPVYLLDDGKSKEAECTAMEITGGV